VPFCCARLWALFSDFASPITSTRAALVFADFRRVAIDWPLPQ
jgi:hypothetical protein